MSAFIGTRWRATCGLPCAKAARSAPRSVSSWSLLPCCRWGSAQISICSARIAPGMLWIALLLAALLSLPRVFEGDYEDGALEVMAAGARRSKLVAAANRSRTGSRPASRLRCWRLCSVSC